MGVVCFNRSHLHRHLLQHSPRSRSEPLPALFRQRFTHMVYVLSCEWAYLRHCCRGAGGEAEEQLQQTLTTLAHLHM